MVVLVLIAAERTMHGSRRRDKLATLGSVHFAGQHCFEIFQDEDGNSKVLGSAFAMLVD